MMVCYQRFACAVILLTSLFATSFAQQEEKPILKLETGMHTATAKAISTDARGRYLLSCGNDKIAIFREAATGRLLNILRIPIGEGDDGKLYACALSPDANIAAVGGWTEDGDDMCIYLLNPFTRQLIKRLVKLPQVVNRLEFSRDGQWLAAGLSDKGIVVYNTRTWKATRLSENYDDKVQWLNFDQHNNLAAVYYKGYIRIYSGTDFLLKSQSKLPTNKIPYSVAFNPAGTLLAVGYNQNPAVDVLDARNLQLAYKPTMKEVPTNQALSAVCFSSDGTSLYAGGSFNTLDSDGSYKYMVRKWEHAGKGNCRDYFCLANAVLGIIPLRSNIMALIGAYPDMAVFNRTGLGWSVEADNLDFARIRDFAVSDDEQSLDIISGYNTRLVFNIKNRSISDDHTATARPITKNGALQLSNWKEQEPIINHRHLNFLIPDETCRSACIHPDGSKIAWGGDYYLYLTDDTGKLKWKTPLPDAAFAVNIAGDGKVVVAALGDGTIRWYSIENDGKELLAFYSRSSDRRKWVLFSPKGYYDASAGAEDLLGWHINKGRDSTPGFYPASRFKDNFYRPDIIDAIAETWDEDEAIELSNNKTGKVEQAISSNQLPPTVVINDPYTNTSFTGEVVSVTFTIESPSGSTVARPEIRVNSRSTQVEMDREIRPLKNQPITARVNVPTSNCTISITARNEFGTSPEAKVYLKYDSLATVLHKSQKKPRLFILAIGISDYKNADYKLNYAAADARAFVDAFQNQEGRMYEKIIVKLLLNKKATRDSILAAFDWIQKQGNRNDMSMIFFAGHGVNSNNGTFYLVPAAARFDDLKVTCVNSSDLTQTVKEIKGQVAVFIDACHSGNVTGGGRLLSDITRTATELGNAQNGAVVFTSSLSKEQSQERSDWKHGAFTFALLEGLKGAGRSSVYPTKISYRSLAAFVSGRVNQLTNDMQNPTLVASPDTPDFNIAEINN